MVLKNAEYRNDYLNINYRGIKTKRISSSGIAYDFGTNISYDKINQMKICYSQQDATSLSGIYTDGDLLDPNDLDGYVTITNSLNDSAINYTVKGYDQDGIK